MKVSDANAAVTTSPWLLKNSKPTKIFKHPRRRTNLLPKGISSSPYPIPSNNYQIIPLPPLWTNTQLSGSTPTLTLINPANSNPLSAIISPTTSYQRPMSDMPVFPSFKAFTTPRLTTTFVPLNVCHSEHTRTVIKTSEPPINIVENRQQDDLSRQKIDNNITTHVIDNWIIRERSAPFVQKENELSSSSSSLTKEQITDRCEQLTSVPFFPSNIAQWTTDHVCSFFERTLGKNCYTPIIKEHLVDGTALLLLQDEHLNSIFKMQLGPRLKLLDRVAKLKRGDLVAL